jgi:TubC N-terminal docking domain
MSAALDILKRAKAAGVMLAADGGQLKLKAPKEPPRELLDELRAHKPELLALLSQHVGADGNARIAIAAWAQLSPSPLTIDGAAVRIEAWLHAMDRLPKASGAEGLRLQAVTKDFARGPWSYPAIRCAWSDAQLFGLDGGLVPEMSRRALHFRSIAEQVIVLINGRGQLEEWPRLDMPGALPWWEDERCIARFH